MSGNGVGVPEGHALFGEIVGAVRGVDEAVARRLAHVVGADGHGVQHGGKDRQAHLHGVHRVKDRLLVLLHILVVGKRQALHGSEEAHEVAVDPARLSPHQLGHVRVLLRGHDGGAGGVGVVQLDELELPAAPEDNLLGKAGEVHHEDGESAQKLQGVVPVGDPVQGIAHGPVKSQTLGGHEAVDGIGSACQGAGAQGAVVQPLGAVLQPGDVPGEHRRVGHEVLGKGYGLGPLEMGVAGHDGGLVLSGLAAEHRLQLQELFHDDGDLLPDVHPEVQSHLVVPGSAGVEALSRVPDALGEEGLHIHVDILVVGGEFHLPRLDVSEDGLEALHDGLRVGGGDDARGPQHLGVCHGAGDVLLVEPLVKLDGGVEVVDKGVGILAEPPGPEFHSSVLSSRRRDEDPSPPRSCGRVVVSWIFPAGSFNHFRQGVYLPKIL